MAPTQILSKKRKLRPSESKPSSVCGAPHSQGAAEVAAQAQLPKGEYETGRVICESCGEGVSFRDEATGGFTLIHWEDHRLECPTGFQQTPEAAPDAQDIQSEMSNPPAKRRRAKRTEEERIEYLSNDPYVAQFEAYRVLCGCCDKWIRLRPNSTYCSIPWDAHRKSCLAKRLAKSTNSADDRNVVFSGDPTVRKFDAERVLCKLCEEWISLGTTDNDQAIKVWMAHRASCQDDSASTSVHSNSAARNIPTIDSVPPPSKHLLALVSSSLPTPSAPIAKANGSVSISTTANAPPEPSSSYRDFNLTNLTPVQESKRKTAEERAAILHADPMIGEVEPSRVFCTLCRKWVQLRQDSTYCSYPWQQHRGKCVNRHARRLEKETRLQARREAVMDAGAASSEGAEESDEPESEEGVESGDPEDKERRRAQRHEDRRKAKAVAKAEAYAVRHGEGKAHANGMNSRRERSPQSESSDGPEQDMDIDADVEYLTQLAELDTTAGRMEFAFRSVRYLFNSTYTNGDELTIAALVTYLNAAMPPDKHEDYDTTEVTKAAIALHDRGSLVFEGDILRMSD